MVVRCVPVLNETAGYTYHICTICGYNEQLSSIPALEHHYDSTIIAPTCCSGGYTTHRCPECSDHYTEYRQLCRSNGTLVGRMDCGYSSYGNVGRRTVYCVHGLRRRSAAGGYHENCLIFLRVRWSELNCNDGNHARHRWIQRFADIHC